MDTDTGEIIDASIFVAALPYSGYSYVEAFMSQDQAAWTTAHVNAYAYFGGVTRILVPDNLKTGVIKHTRSEVILNRTYQELAEHYGTAIIPARVKRPKDKASVEGTVGIVSTYILAAIRNQRFFSLRELNEVIRICSHIRLHGQRGQYSTIEAHMSVAEPSRTQSVRPGPPNHQQYMQWNGERFRAAAAKIGANTATVVESILTSYKVEQPGCMAEQRVYARPGRDTNHV